MSSASLIAGGPVKFMGEKIFAQAFEENVWLRGTPDKFSYLSWCGAGPCLMRGKVWKSIAKQIGSAPNMTPYMERPFLRSGYTPPHCLVGHYYIRTCRTYGDMNCWSQFFSNLFRYTARCWNFVVRLLTYSYTQNQYVGITCSIRDSNGTHTRCLVQVGSPAALWRKVRGWNFFLKKHLKKLFHFVNLLTWFLICHDAAQGLVLCVANFEKV